MAHISVFLWFVAFSVLAMDHLDFLKVTGHPFTLGETSQIVWLSFVNNNAGWEKYTAQTTQNFSHHKVWVGWSKFFIDTKEFMNKKSQWFKDPDKQDWCVCHVCSWFHRQSGPSKLWPSSKWQLVLERSIQSGFTLVRIAVPGRQSGVGSSEQIVGWWLRLGGQWQPRDPEKQRAPPPAFTLLLLCCPWASHWILLVCAV